MRRYEIRNEYGAGEVDLYKSVDKDDPEILLEGIAMAGLVGVLRQLGDLAEFAAEIFHDLHEDVMATAARGHDLMARVHQLEAEVPYVEKSFLTQSHQPFLSNPGVGWHPSINIEHNTITQGNLPRFVMDSCEECRGPPRLFLLDKFDVAGAGACLKRYTDPAFFKAQAEATQIANVDKKSRKVKKKASRWRRGDNPESVMSSNTTLHDLLSKDFVKTVHATPTRLLKMKRKFSNGFQIDVTNYVEKFRETILQESSFAEDGPEFSNLNSYGSGLDIHEINVVSPVRGKELVISSFDMNVGESENTDGALVKLAESMSEMDTDVSSLKIGMRSDDTNSEMGIYLDALASVESENDQSSKYVAPPSANFSDSRSFGRSSVSYEWDNLPSKGRSSLDDFLSNTSDLRLRESRTPDGDEFSCSSSQLDTQLALALRGPEVNKTTFDPPILSCSPELVCQVECVSESERVVSNNVNEPSSSKDIACLNESSSDFQETNVHAAFHDFTKMNDTSVDYRKKMVDLDSESNSSGVSHIVTSIQEVNANARFGDRDLSTFIASNENEAGTVLDNGFVASSENRKEFCYVVSANDVKDGLSLNDEASVPYSEIREDLHSLVASDEEIGAIDGGVEFSDTRDDLNPRVASILKGDANASSVPYSDIREDLHSFVPSIGRTDRHPNDEDGIAHSHTVADSHYHQKLPAFLLSKDVNIMADEVRNECDPLNRHSSFAISDVARSKAKASSSLEWEKTETAERFVNLGENLSSLHDMIGTQPESIGGSLLQNKYQISEPEKKELAGFVGFPSDIASFPSTSEPVASSLIEDLPPLPPLPPIQWRTGKLPLFMQPSVAFDSMNESASASVTHKNINHICLDAGQIPVNEKEISCDFEDEQKGLNSYLPEHSNPLDLKSSQRDLSLETPDMKFQLSETCREISSDFDGDEQRSNANPCSSDESLNLMIIESSKKSEKMVRALETGKEIVCDFDSEEHKINSDLCPPHQDLPHLDIKSSSSDINLETPDIKIPYFDSEKESSYDLNSETPGQNSRLSEAGNEASSDWEDGPKKLHANLSIHHDGSTSSTSQSSENNLNSEQIIRHSNSGNELSYDFDEAKEKFNPILPSPHADPNGTSIESSQEDPSSESKRNVSHSSGNEISQYVEQYEISSIPIPHVDTNPTDSISLQNDLTSNVHQPKTDEQEVLPSGSGSEIKPNEKLPWSTNTLSLPPTFGVGKLHKNRQSLPRNPLIDAAAAVDKSKLRKVTKYERPNPPPSLTERDSLQLKKVSGKSIPKIEQRDSLLEQIRTKSFNLKPASMARSTIQNVPAPKTNLKVAAILEKANAIRQALAGSDESDDSEDWADS